MKPRDKKLRELHKSQQPIIREIIKLEKRYGLELTRSACFRHYSKVREEQKRLKAIEIAERELEQLRKQK